MDCGRFRYFRAAGVQKNLRVFIDTHVFLWALNEPERLGKRARSLLEDPENELALSVASVWEMAIKIAHKRLRLPDSFRAFVIAGLRSLGVTVVPIEIQHVFVLAELPQHHADPFDRMIVAQALSARVPVVTADAAFARYDLKIIRA